MSKIDLIIPAFNEKHRIEPTLRSYVDYFDDRVRLVVVLNGCTDSTLDVVKSVKEKHQDAIQIIDIKEPIGKGGAIIEGWKQSDATYVGFIDADGSTAPYEFDKVIAALTPEGPGVIASRFLPASKILERQSALRTLMSRVFIWLMHRLFKMPYSDTQCGAKLFRRDVINEILPTVTATDMSFDVDLLWQLHKAGYRAREVSTVWIDKPGSASLDKKFAFLSTGLGMVYKLFRLRFRTAK